jgi:hypothetical protein
MSVAFGVRQANGVGTSDTDIRHMLRYKWANTGVVGGLAVKGTSRLVYHVAEGMAICSKGDGDGYTEAYFPGGDTPEVKSNEGGNPRIDVVWITAHDASQGDSDNLVTLGVTQGTPSASPVEPDIPTYAVRLGAFRMGAGAATTSGAVATSGVDYAIISGASKGVLLDKRYNSERHVKRGGAFIYASGTVNLPTKRLVQVSLTASVWAYNMATHDWDGSGYIDYRVDGAVKREYRFVCFPESPVTPYFSDIIELPAGSHTFSAALWGSGTKPVSDIWLSGNGPYGDWPGQRLVVIDMGTVD